LKGHPSLEGIPAERIWKAALGDDPSTADGSRALCRGLLQSKDQVNQLQQFCELCDEGVDLLHTQLSEWAGRFRNQVANQTAAVDVEAVISKVSIHSGWSRKVLGAYVWETVPSTSHIWQDLLQEQAEDLEFTFSLLRWNLDGRVSIEGVEIVNAAFKATSSQASERGYVGRDDNQRHIVRSTLIPTASLDTPPKGVEDHICNTYLVRTVGNFLGKAKASIMDETQIEIGEEYDELEGKLKGMWEQLQRKIL
jgi:hypothetical protein